MNAYRPPKPHPVDASAALAIELAQEQASTLGRLGRGLEAALLALSQFDQRDTPLGAQANTARQRDELVRDAGMALWHFVIQREAMGLRDSTRVMRDYAVPMEVQNRMGVLT